LEHKNKNKKNRAGMNVAMQLGAGRMWRCSWGRQLAAYMLQMLPFLALIPSYL
jgi:hypothetical protein